MDSLQVPAPHPQTSTFPIDCTHLPLGLHRLPTAENPCEEQRTVLRQARGQSGRTGARAYPSTRGGQSLQDGHQERAALLLRAARDKSPRPCRELRQLPHQRTHAKQQLMRPARPGTCLPAGRNHKNSVSPHSSHLHCRRHEIYPADACQIGMFRRYGISRYRLSVFHYQYCGIGRYAFFTTGESQFFGSGGFDGHIVGIYPHDG